nr:hypothetical protein [Tanacetum cinerariifolium]
MGDENPIRTLRDYSKPSHEGYRKTIELLVGNNVDFLKLVDSLDLDGANRKRTRLHLFRFSLRDQASNWLERLPAGSITTWEDLTTCFLVQFFPPGRIAKLRNDILIFQQHHGESLSEAWTLVPTTLSIAWKISNKPSLNMHPRVPTKREGKKSHRNRKRYAHICRKYELRYGFHYLENIEANIDPSLSHVVFGRPFVEIACLTINRKYGLMTFTDGIKKVTFKTLYKDTKRSELSSEGYELSSSRIILSEDDYDKERRKPSDLEDGFYRDTIKLGPEYVTGMDDEGEVT